MTNDQQGKLELCVPGSRRADDWLHYRWCRCRPRPLRTFSPVTGYLFVFNLFACLSVGFQMFARANTKDAALSSAEFHLPPPPFSFPFGKRRQIVSIFVTTDEPRDLISSYRLGMTCRGVLERETRNKSQLSSILLDQEWSSHVPLPAFRSHEVTHVPSDIANRPNIAHC